MDTKRSNVGALIGGAILIAFGVLALAGQIFRALDWGFLWPFIIIGFGALFFVAMFAGGKQTAVFAIPASIVSGIGLVLLFQNITNHWESMSYFWTLIVMFVGVGIYIMGLYDGTERRKQAGMRLMKVGFILFVIFGAFFEMLFTGFRPSSGSGFVFPSLLIIIGIYLLLTRSGVLGRSKTETPQPKETLPPTD
jgi:hypothetical protein